MFIVAESQLMLQKLPQPLLTVSLHNLNGKISGRVVSHFRDGYGNIPLL